MKKSNRLRVLLDFSHGPPLSRHWQEHCALLIDSQDRFYLGLVDGDEQVKAEQVKNLTPLTLRQALRWFAELAPFRDFMGTGAELCRAAAGALPLDKRNEPWPPGRFAEQKAELQHIQRRMAALGVSASELRSRMPQERS